MAKCDGTIAMFRRREAIHRVVNIRGRTGAVLGMLPLSRDDAASVAGALATHFDATSLAMTRFVAVECPSNSLWVALRKVLPNVDILSLDAMHLPIVYEYGFWRKRTKGSHALRRIMTKFTPRVHPASLPELGPPFRSQHVPDTFRTPTTRSAHVSSPSLSPHTTWK